MALLLLFHVSLPYTRVCMVEFHNNLFLILMTFSSVTYNNIFVYQMFNIDVPGDLRFIIVYLLSHRKLC